MFRSLPWWKAWILGAACGALFTFVVDALTTTRTTGTVVELAPGDTLAVPMNGGTLRLVLEVTP